MRRSQFLKIMGVLLVPGMLVLLAPGAWAAESSGVPANASAETPAPALTGSCVVKKVSFATKETVTDSTTSTTFVTIPNSTVSFIQGGSQPGCIKVEFAGAAFAADSGGASQLMIVRALLDGGTVGSPNDVSFSGDDDVDSDFKWARSHAMNFAFTGVAPGPHTIEIQFRSSTGGTVFMHKASTFVHHR